PNVLAPNPSWLGVTPASGTSAGGQTGAPIALHVNPVGLPAGQYYGSVNVSAPNALNSPQSVSVLLNVLQSSQTLSGASLSAGGLIFAGAAGGPLPLQQQVAIFNPSNASVSYSALAVTANGTGWLTVSPTIGAASPG